MNVLTILVLVVLVGTTVYGYHKGLLHAVYSLLTGVLAMILVTIATPFMATFLTEFTTLDTRIEEQCHEQLRDTVKKAGNSKKNDKEQQKKELEALGISLPEVVVDHLLESNSKADELLEESGVYSGMSARVTRMAMNGISFLIIMVVLLVAFRIIYKIFHIIEKFPIIGEANKGLGAALGLAAGMFIVWVCFAIVAMTGASNTAQHIIAEVYESPILVVIYENNLILTLMMQIF